MKKVEKEKKRPINESEGINSSEKQVKIFKADDGSKDQDEKKLEKESRTPTDHQTETGKINKNEENEHSDTNKLLDRDGKSFERLDDDIMQINVYETRDINGTTNTHNTNETNKWNEKTDYEEKATNSGIAVRQYAEAYARVKEFYTEQHELQTVDYNIQARVNFMSKCRAKMTIWEALERLNSLIDESDPDTELSQIQHALQTAEAIRKDGKPRWMQLTGLIHDLGKLLYFFDSSGQWDVVGDTFPVGCAFDERIIFYEAFKKNPDFSHPIYSTKLGIYSENCGLEKIMISWGHDEYMYHIAKQQSTLPKEALAMIRYHSFYAWHRENAYTYLMNDEDVKMLEGLRAFNPYDLYSKQERSMDVDKVKGYYLSLIDEYFPEKIVRF